MPAIATILAGATISVWLALVPLLFYYLFVLGNHSNEETKKKRMYAWGLKVYMMGVMIFSIGNVFFTRSLSDLSQFCNACMQFFNGLIEYLPQILGGVCWVLAILVFVYFFALRRPMKKKKLDEQYPKEQLEKEGTQ